MLLCVSVWVSAFPFDVAFTKRSFNVEQMRFTILYVEVTPTPGVVIARVRYVPSGSFTSHKVRLQILLLCFHTSLTEVVGRSC